MPAFALPTFDAVHGVKEAQLCNISLARTGSELIRNSDEDTKHSRACKGAYAQTRDELLRMFAFPFAVREVLVPADASYNSPSLPWAYAYKAEDHRRLQGAAALGDTEITASVWVDMSTGLANSSLKPLSSLVGRIAYGTGIPDGTRITGVTITAGTDGLATQVATIALDRPTTAAITGFCVKYGILKILGLDGSDNTVFETQKAQIDRRILCDVATGSDEDGVQCVSMKFVEQVIDPDFFDPMFRDALALRIASKIVVTLALSMSMGQALQAEFSAVMQMAQVASSEESQVDTGGDYATVSSRNAGTRR